MNTRLLRRVQKAILEEPKRMNMEKWVMSQGEIPSKKMPKCGTVGCIYGWCAALTSKKMGEELYLSIIKELDCIDKCISGLLGIQYDQVRSLVYVTSWPLEWSSKLYKHNPQTKAYAKVVSDYIDWFIATKAGTKSLKKVKK